MSADTVPRRVRVERNVYRRPDGKLEIGYRDASGKQRFRVVHGGIEDARERAYEQIHSREAHRREAAADLTARRRRARVRAKADLSDAYGYIRQALQAVDRAETHRFATLLTRQATSALHAAEDAVVRARRESM